MQSLLTSILYMSASLCKLFVFHCFFSWEGEGQRGIKAKKRGRKRDVEPAEDWL